MISNQIVATAVNAWCRSTMHLCLYCGGHGRVCTGHLQHPAGWHQFWVRCGECGGTGLRRLAR